MDTSYITSLDLFEGLTVEATQKIEQQSRIVQLFAGQRLFHSEKAPDNLVVVIHGVLQVCEFSKDSRLVGIRYKVQRDLIGCLDLLEGPTVHQNMLAITASTVLIIPGSLIRELLSTHSALANKFLKLSNDYIFYLKQIQAMLSLPNAFQRVFTQINILFQCCNSEPITLPKHSEIAKTVNTSRETVSRALSALIKCGALQKIGNHVVIKKADLLQQLASNGFDALAHYQPKGSD